MVLLKPHECVNPTYQTTEDTDSHHYIEPMEWVSGPVQNNSEHLDSYRVHQQPDYDSEEQHSPQLRQRTRFANIRDELPSRQKELTQAVENEITDGDATVKRHNSNLTTLRFRATVMRQMDHNALFDLLSDHNATSEEVRETLRSANQSLTLKRQVKAKLSQEEEARKKHKTVSFAKRIKYHFAMSWQHLKQEVWTLSQSMDLWHSHLKAVQGHFGSGVASYFYFLRRLFFLNLLACVLIVSFVVVPQAVWDTSEADTSTVVPFGGYELLTGGASFRDTVLYYGHYTNETLTGYKMPEAYFFTYATYIICCIFILTFSVAKTYRINYIETAGELKNVFSPKLLAAWDYTIEKESSARLKSRSIYNELLELIAVQSQDMEPQNFSTRFFIYLWRILINLLILAGTAATGFLVYWLLGNVVTDVDIPVLKEVTVALVVTAILFAVPFVFSLISRWENYSSRQTHIYLNIVRVVILRTVTLGVVVAFWLSKNEAATQTSGDVCWETRLGQEMYRLIIIDFLCILLLPTFVMEFLRRISYDLGCKWMGYPEFDIAQNTLDLVYTQMLVWIGFFYSPLLPFIALAKLFIIFYIKRLSVIQYCHPPLKAWRAAHAQTLFLTLTFLCFMLSLMSLGYGIFKIYPSTSCGPFRNKETVYNTVLDLIGTSERSNKVWQKLLSPGVVAGLLLFLCVVVYYKRATAKAQMDMVELLREQLTLEGKDKVFLLRLFETAMQQQQICSYMKNNMKSSDNVINREKPVPPNSVAYSMNNLTRVDVSDTPDKTNYTSNKISAENNDRGYPDERLRRDRLGELQRENYGSRSTSRESSPMYSKSTGSQDAFGYSQEGHPFGARNSPPFGGGSQSKHSSRDGSPYTGPSQYRHSGSPQDPTDRRSSESSQRSLKINQVPLFMKPVHQHGFRQLTPGPQAGGSRQPTPQRQ